MAGVKKVVGLEKGGCQPLSVIGNLLLIMMLFSLIILHEMFLAKL